MLSRLHAAARTHTAQRNPQQEEQELRRQASIEPLLLRDAAKNW